jgi:hypothetical protein
MLDASQHQEELLLPRIIWILGFQLNCIGYKPLPSRVDAIVCINPPKNIKQICSFLGMINFIKNHILKWAEICKPITRLTQKDIRFVWGKEQQEAFDKVKVVISETIVLEYSNPNCPFNIYPNASSTYVIRAILVQGRMVISTFSWNLNDGQLNYTVTGQELLAEVEACNHFCQTICGWKIRIYTDHQNLPMRTHITSITGSTHRVSLIQNLLPPFFT